MSAICGFYTPHITYAAEDTHCRQKIIAMLEALHRRGPNATGSQLFRHGAVGHGQLTAGGIHRDIARRSMPFTLQFGEQKYTLLYDGFISNLLALRDELIHSDHKNAACPSCQLAQEEILLMHFYREGPDFVRKLRGAFAMVILDESNERLFLFRDPLGLRPLYYMQEQHSFLFASEPKGILSYPDVTPTLDRQELCELIGLGPAHSLGRTLYHGMAELRAGHYLTVTRERTEDICYHQFSLREHQDSYDDTMAHVTELLNQSIHVLSDASAPIASLLSGGLDSSVITAALCKEYEARDTAVTSTMIPENNLTTFSFEFLGSREHFVPNSFQPSLDAPFVKEMVDYLHTDHTTLVCSNQEQLDALHASVLAHDGPCMADVDSSMLYFNERIAPSYPIVYSGECADELFCGYPWYHNTSMIIPDRFPWSRDLCPRLSLLNDDYINSLSLEDYVTAQYHFGIAELDPSAFEHAVLPEDLELIHKRTMYLTIRYFMQTLVDRADRIASYCGMDLRVPFADLDLAEYLFQIPYSMKTTHGEVKHLLREYAKDLLPETVRNRRKSPYPKTYDPGYEQLIHKQCEKLLQHQDAPLFTFIDPTKLRAALEQPSDYGTPWFGQLMAGPQLLAYMLQINDWLESYHVKIVI